MRFALSRSDPHLDKIINPATGTGVGRTVPLANAASFAESAVAFLIHAIAGCCLHPISRGCRGSSVRADLEPTEEAP
jgi:hypothetical protein